MKKVLIVFLLLGAGEVFAAPVKRHYQSKHWGYGGAFCQSQELIPPDDFKNDVYSDQSVSGGIIIKTLLSAAIGGPLAFYVAYGCLLYFDKLISKKEGV